MRLDPSKLQREMIFPKIIIFLWFQCLATINCFYEAFYSFIYLCSLICCHTYAAQPFGALETVKKLFHFLIDAFTWLYGSVAVKVLHFFYVWVVIPVVPNRLSCLTFMIIRHALCYWFPRILISMWIWFKLLFWWISKYETYSDNCFRNW